MYSDMSLTEIFMRQARMAVARHEEIAKAIHTAEDALDATPHYRKYKTVQQDALTWEAVSSVANKILHEKGQESDFVKTYHAYMAGAKSIVMADGYDAEKLRQFQFDQNCTKLDHRAKVIGMNAVLEHLGVKRNGKIAEKDLKAAFRALDSHIRLQKTDGALGHYLAVTRDEIVREVRDIAIASRREFKALKLQSLAA